MDMSTLKALSPNSLVDHELPIRFKLPQHFTASAVVLCRNHILMVHHKRIAAWLPPGGHIDAGEMPHEAAVREVREETGVEVNVLSEPMPISDDPDAFFLHSPLCMHGVRAVEKGTEVYHVDIAFLCRVQDDSEGLPAVRHAEEVNEARWIALDDLDSFVLAKNVRQVVDKALAKMARSSPQI